MPEKTKKKTTKKSTAKSKKEKKTAKKKPSGTPKKKSGKLKAKAPKKASKAKKKVLKTSAVQSAPAAEEIDDKDMETKKVDSLKNESTGRDELDRLIASESVNDQAIFSSRPAEPAPEPDQVTNEPEAKIDQIDQKDAEDETVYMSHGEPVSLYRRFLLWSSVGLCASVIGFGWFITIGGSLGIKDAAQEPSDATEMIQQFNDQIEEDLDEFRETTEERQEKTQVDDEALNALVEEINKNSNEEQEAEEGRDIFIPPDSASNTDEVSE
jgi:hypothetical protein